MKKSAIKLYNVIDNTQLPELVIDKPLTDGDPLEIEGEMYYVCETSSTIAPDAQMIGVIPLVVRNPGKVSNIEHYIHCLSLAHRKVQFKNEKGNCNLEDCNEMNIS